MKNLDDLSQSFFCLFFFLCFLAMSDPLRNFKTKFEQYSLVEISEIIFIESCPIQQIELKYKYAQHRRTERGGEDPPPSLGYLIKIAKLAHSSFAMFAPSFSPPPSLGRCWCAPDKNAEII